MELFTRKYYLVVMNTNKLTYFLAISTSEFNYIMKKKKSKITV